MVFLHSNGAVAKTHSNCRLSNRKKGGCTVSWDKSRAPGNRQVESGSQVRRHTPVSPARWRQRQKDGKLGQPGLHNKSLSKMRTKKKKNIVFVKITNISPDSKVQLTRSRLLLEACELSKFLPLPLPSAAKNPEHST